MILLDPDARPNIGHRGASGSYPENTLLAFTEAIRAGVDAIEFDVRVTRDDVPVVLHDGSVDRTTDGSGMLAEIKLETVRQFDAGAGEKIPLLDEVLETFRETAMILEIKEEAAANAVRKCLIAHQAVDRVLLGSLDHRALAAFDRDRFLVGATRRSTAAFFAGSRLNLAVPGAYRAFCVPERTASITLVDRRFVSNARKASKPVHVWTVDDIEQARRLRAIGVAGLISNFPARMSTLEDRQ